MDIAKKQSKRYNRARKALIFWCLFIGIGAVGGSTAMLVEPSGVSVGFDALIPYFQVLPFANVLFQNFIFPGISLLIVNGLTNLIAAYLMLRKKHIGDILGGVFGITLMMWICIQFVIFPTNIMSTLYFFFGLAQACTGYACNVFYKQENFEFDPASYTNVGSGRPAEAPSDEGSGLSVKAITPLGDESVLVVYFSRLSRTAKVAYECANKLGADIYEIKTKEKTDGTLGFWWCGRFGMHKWAMELDESNGGIAGHGGAVKQTGAAGQVEAVNLERYERVVICTPVWVFSVAAPVRAFLEKYSGKVQRTSYIAVHFNPWLPKSFFDEMDSILGVKGDGRYSVCCQLGKMKLK